MATGTGKTVVMAMLIAWHALNKLADPQEARVSPTRSWSSRRASPSATGSASSARTTPTTTTASATLFRPR